MAAHGSGVETVLLAGEVDGDEGKDVRRDAVDVNEGVLPLVDGCKCGQNIPVELGNRFQAESTKPFSVSLCNKSEATLNIS